MQGPLILTAIPLAEIVDLPRFSKVSGPLGVTELKQRPLWLGLFSCPGHLLCQPHIFCYNSAQRQEF